MRTLDKLRRGNTDMQPFCSPDPLRTLKGIRTGCGAFPKTLPKCGGIVFGSQMILMREY